MYGITGGVLAAWTLLLSFLMQAPLQQNHQTQNKKSQQNARQIKKNGFDVTYYGENGTKVDRNYLLL